jgi:hypothetical protein
MTCGFGLTEHPRVTLLRKTVSVVDSPVYTEEPRKLALA